jgi:diaminohydroxyphosphoribosylaminopyrimidine deaminase/5-amino-6-(5-phosphoribosylamino)uracil reductase
MESETETAAMRRAIELSRHALGTTSPNPNVGAVVLDAQGRVAGIGHTAPAGGPHAEIRALAEAGQAAQFGTVISTLEPCNHAVADPTPLGGGGAITLRAAGVQVHSGVLLHDAFDAMRPWLIAVGRGWPWVVWKFASTLDGRSAAADGSSKWITSAAARADVHRLRGRVDAIIAGSGTVLADDPHLTVRGDDGELLERQPLRVIVDGSGRTPIHAKVLDGAAPTWVVSADGGSAGRVDLQKMLEALYGRGVRAALLEGGPTLAGVFLRLGLIDRVVGYVAPKLLGAGPAILGDAGIAAIDQALELDFHDITRIGRDLRLTADLNPRGV